jgi:hypothetical protein
VDDQGDYQGNRCVIAFTVQDGQLVYLQRKYKNIKRTNENSFTELYMNNLLHLVEHLDNMASEAGLEFLPDLQKMDTTCSSADLGN